MIILLLLLLFVYFPVLTTIFPFHNDGYLITSHKFDWFGFAEAPHILMLGRALGAILVSVQSWFTHQIFDLTISRWILLVTVFLCAVILRNLLIKRWALEPFWATLMACGFVLIPPNQLNIIWVANGSFGPGSVLLAVASYLLMDRAVSPDIPITNLRKCPKILSLLLSAVLFILALFIYQPSAMIVFALTFALIFLTKADHWLKMRLILLRDVVFYTASMAAYYVINHLIMVPTGRIFFPYQDPSHSIGIYQSKLKAFNLWDKNQLVVDTLYYSLSGVFSLFEEFRMIFTLLVFVLGAVALSRFIAYARKKQLPNIFFKTVALGACFILANLPCFIAPASFDMIGYRVLLPSSLIGIILIFGTFRTVSEVIGPEIAFWAKMAAVGLIAFMMFLARGNVYEVVTNNAKLYNFIKNQTQSMDASAEHLVIGLTEKNFLNHPLSYEFGYSLTTSDHIYPILKEVLDPRGLKVPFITTYRENQNIYLDPKSYLIDLTKINDRPIRPRAHAMVRVFQKPPKDVLVDAIDHNLLTFYEYPVNKNGQFWKIDPTIKHAILDIGYDRLDKRWQGYRMIGVCYDSSQTPCAFSWLLQGSNDGKTWQPLDARKTNIGAHTAIRKGYQIAPGEPLNYYRFIFEKKNAQDTVKIFAIEIKFD